MTSVRKSLCIVEGKLTSFFTAYYRTTILQVSGNQNCFLMPILSRKGLFHLGSLKFFSNTSINRMQPNSIPYNSTIHESEQIQNFYGNSNRPKATCILTFHYSSFHRFSISFNSGRKSNETHHQAETMKLNRHPQQNFTHAEKIELQKRRKHNPIHNPSTPH